VKLNNDAPIKVTSRTVIMLDVTNSMHEALEMTKNQIREFFLRVQQVLQQQQIDSGFEMQIVAYRNYNAPINELLEFSPWASQPSNLEAALKKLEVNWGWGPEAIEAGFIYVENESKSKPITQVILIGDAPAQTAEDATNKRAQGHGGGESYWSSQHPDWAPNGLGQPAGAADVIQRMRNTRTPVPPVHAYYIDKRAKASFEQLANMTNGSSGFLNIRKPGGAEALIGLICTQILETLGGQSARQAYEDMFNKPSFS